MTTDLKHQIFQEIKGMIIPLLNDHLKKIVLYGSYATNKETAESDIDFLILTDLQDSDINKLNNKINEITKSLSLKYNVFFSFVFINVKHYQKYLDVIPYYMNTSKDGIIIYER